MPKYHPPSLFRSEEMALCQFFIQDEVAYACIEMLGNMEAVQFRDVNGDMVARLRPYNTELNMLLDCQKILKDLETQININELPVAQSDDNIPTPSPGDLLDICETLEKFEREVKELKSYISNLNKGQDEIIELKSILQLAQKYSFNVEDEVQEDEFNEFSERVEEEKDTLRNMEAGTRVTQEMRTMKINVIGGVMQRQKFASFERTLWRASRGKMFVKFDHIDHESENSSEVAVLKTAFIVFLQGEKFREICTKVIDGYRSKVYSIPENTNQIAERIKKLDEQREDLKTVIDVTEKHYKELLDTCAQNLENWYTQVIKMKAVYVALNNFAVKPHVGEGWLAIGELPKIREALRKTSKDAGGITDPVITVMDTDEQPPTYFWTDKFTRGYQVLIDSYGIATYKEINPMPFTVITFPFLFGMMFGDLGHGTLLLIFGLTMIIREKQMMKVRTKNEIRNILFAGRYIIAMMGIFSMYSGFIYNDCLSLSMNLFGSSWSVTQDFDEIKDSDAITLNPAIHYSSVPYPMGMDPVWSNADNKIIFLNSFKMKISIIFGVCQMLLGLGLSVWNDWYFGHYSNIVCMFIPEVLWMVCIFGWLCILMIIKWVLYGANRVPEREPKCAPSVLIMFISMFLHQQVPQVSGCYKEMFSNQGVLQEALFVCAIVCLPWILLAKPIWFFRKHGAEYKKQRVCETLMKRAQKLKVKRDKRREKNELEDGDQETLKRKDDIEKGAEGDRREETMKKDVGVENTGSKDNSKLESKSEFMIHQTIITIEYVLGTISHTASYLRLWALSLAHSQLSEVLWSKLLSKVIWISGTIPYQFGFVILFFGWGMFAILTISILVLMEGLSAFLHTLRLHWVEFNSKFYSGLGYEFVPFSFQKILSAERGF